MADLPDTPYNEEAYNRTEGRAALGGSIKDKFAVYKKDRRAAEDQWMLNVRQYLGKYDPSLEQNMDANTSRAYPKLTRVKVVSMVSRLMALLFPAGENNWGLSASPVPNLPAETLISALDAWRVQNPGAQPTAESLTAMVLKTAADIAQRQETVINDQLQDVDPYAACSYETLVRKVVFSAVMYGPGVMKGPMTVADKVTSYQIDSAGVPQIVETDAFRPYLEFVPCWDYYPDMSAASFEQMDGEFQRHVYSRHQATQLAERDDFDGPVILAYLQANPDGNYEKYTYEEELQALGGQNSSKIKSGGKYEFHEYWGSAPGSKLRAAGAEIKDEQVSLDVRYCAWILDGKVVKLNINPFPEGTHVYHQFVFEEDEVNLLGSGLPPIMRDSQLAVSSAARMLIDNASVVCGPNLEVDLDVLSPSQTDYSVKPRKVWLKEGGTGNQRAVQSVSFESHIPALLSIVTAFRGFADDETFVSPVTGGDLENVPGEAMRTTGGASMVYGNAALPFRDIVRNFDRFTTSVISAMVSWNLVFNEDRAAMKGDTRPVPRGATTLMAKEVRAFALDQLANTLTPEERMYIDERELLKQRLTVRDLPLDQLLASPEEVQKRQDAAAQAGQTAADQAAAMFAAQLANMQSDTVKQISQAQKNLDSADVAVFEALLNAITSGATPDELSAIATRANASRQGQQTSAGVGDAGPVSGVGGV
jgi:hypothetical protein